MEYPDFKEHIGALTVSDSDAPSESYLTPDPRLAFTKTCVVFVSKERGCATDVMEIPPDDLYDYRMLIRIFKFKNGWVK